jgi:hypothetical protein
MIFMGGAMVGDVEAFAFKYHRGRMEDAPGFTLAARADGLRFIVKALSLLKTMKARAAFILINWHGINHLVLSSSLCIFYNNIASEARRTAAKGKRLREKREQGIAEAPNCKC